MLADNDNELERTSRDNAFLRKGKHCLYPLVYRFVGLCNVTDQTVVHGVNLYFAFFPARHQLAATIAEVSVVQSTKHARDGPLQAVRIIDSNSRKVDRDWSACRSGGRAFGALRVEHDREGKLIELG